MKRLLCLFFAFWLCLSGCSLYGDWIKEPVHFYYVHANYQKDMQKTITSEVREASGHKGDLVYLLALYSMGPSKDSLLSLLPPNTTIIPTERTDSSLELTLSENVLTMADADFTLASACIALTCMELIDVQQVTIVCAERNITIQENNLMLYNSIVQSTQEETQ